MGEIRLFCSGDGAALARFFEKYFPLDPKKILVLSRSPEYYEWKYGPNPFGKSLGCCYWENGEVTGLGGGVPVPLAIRGERVTGYWGCDGFVASHLQGKGVWQAVESRLYEEFDPLSKIMYTLGPSAQAFAILQRKFNYFETLFYRQAYSPLRMHEVLRGKGMGILAAAGHFVNFARELLARPQAIEVKEVGGIDPTFCPDMSSDLDFTVVRSPEYLEFRYSQCPETYHYFHAETEGLAAVLVVKLVRWQGTVVCYLIDVVGRSPKAQSPGFISGALHAIGIATRAALISFELPVHHIDPSLLRRSGFLVRGDRHAVIMRQKEWPFLNPSSPEYDNRRWVFSSGDGDNF